MDLERGQSAGLIRHALRCRLIPAHHGRQGGDPRKPGSGAAPCDGSNCFAAHLVGLPIRGMAGAVLHPWRHLPLLPTTFVTSFAYCIAGAGHRHQRPGGRHKQAVFKMGPPHAAAARRHDASSRLCWGTILPADAGASHRPPPEGNSLDHVGNSKQKPDCA